MKDKAKAKAEQTKTVLQNVGEFLDAVAFTAVALYTVYSAYQQREDIWFKALLAAGLVVSFQAFRLLVRHFSKRG